MPSTVFSGLTSGTQSRDSQGCSCRQEAGLVQPRRQVDETDHAVLAQGELQQLLAGVVRRQARRLQRLQQAVPAFGVEGERGMGLVEQIQLAQLAAAEFADCACETAQQGRDVSFRDSAELSEQGFGEGQVAVRG